MLMNAEGLALAPLRVLKKLCSYPRMALWHLSSSRCGEFPLPLSLQLSDSQWREGWSKTLKTV